MRSNAGMANRQVDVDLRFAQVSAPQLELWLGFQSQVPVTRMVLKVMLQYAYISRPTSQYQSTHTHTHTHTSHRVGSFFSS